MDKLAHGPLTASTAHLCVDMQNLFAEDTPWRTPWMDRVRPVVAKLARRHAGSTIFTRFVPPERPEDMPGTWRRYFERWREMTREKLDPRLLELVPELGELVPPAVVFDKRVYSPFHDGRLLPYLHRRRIDSLVVSGAETDVCVLTAVLDAVDHGLRVVIAADALCSSADETHDALMKVYNTRFSQQVEVASTDTILAAWRSGPSQPWAEAGVAGIVGSEGAQR
jgi:nicotinamidase-related amidase